MPVLKLCMAILTSLGVTQRSHQPGKAILVLESSWHCGLVYLACFHAQIEATLTAYTQTVHGNFDFTRGKGLCSHGKPGKSNGA